MIEIKTQQEFDTIFATGTSMPSNELIRIFPLEGGGEYITEGIEITKSNVIIEGVAKPKIKQVTELTTKDLLYVYGTSSAEADVLENIIIRGLHLIGAKNQDGGARGRYGINCYYVGFAQTTGLTTGDYSRYDPTTVGNTMVNKIGVRIENCVVEDCRSYGVCLSTSRNCKLVNNTVQNNSYQGIYLYSSSNNNTITGNTVQNNSGYGIYLSSSSNNTITGNTVQNNSSHGINLISSSRNNTITGNTIQNNGSYGINLSSSSNNTITGNTVQNNSIYVIMLSSSNNNTITGNTIQNNSYGIRLHSSSNNNTITGNTVQNNGSIGINLTSSSNNTITGNISRANNDTNMQTVSSNYNLINGNSYGSSSFSGTGNDTSENIQQA